jgi:hypothetical protein
LRTFPNANVKGKDRTKAKLVGNTPYGYAYHDGKLVIDPREQVALRLMLKLSKSGRSNQYIADELNRKKITRTGGQWQFTKGSLPASKGPVQTHQGITGIQVAEGNDFAK